MSMSLNRTKILKVGRTYRPMIEMLVCKGFETCAGPPPQTEDELVSCLANQISSTLNNIHEDFSNEKVIDAIKYTFITTRLIEEVEDYLGFRQGDLRKEFFRDMARVSHDSQITHDKEETGLNRLEESVQHGVEFLLDPSRGGEKIPTSIKERSFRDWERLQKKAEEWAEDYDVSEEVAKREVIPAAIAVEIHTGGNADRVEPYKQYVRELTTRLVLLIEDSENILEHFDN